MFATNHNEQRVMGSVQVRTFAAVPVADPALVRALAGGQAELRRGGGRVRWTAGHQFHYTLKFLGEIPAERVAAAAGALERAAGASARFTLTVTGIGAFPRPESARVVWAGCGAGRRELEVLAARVEAEMIAAGFPAEQRRFSPHLTLGRIPDGGLTPGLASAIRQGAGRSFGALPVHRVVLYRSDLRPGGPVYSSLAEFALAGGNQDL